MERNKKIQVSMGALAPYVKAHYDLPPDAILQGSEYDADRDVVTMTFKHQTFDLVKNPPMQEAKEDEPEPPKRGRKKKGD